MEGSDGPETLKPALTLLTKIDRYIIGKFLGTFFFILALLMAVSVIFDISEKIDNFLRSDAPLQGIILEYYLNFIIYYANLFSALLIFIAVILFTAKMSAQTEIVAILASGVSFNRFLRPYLISATILVILALLFNHFIVPSASRKMNNFKYSYVDYRERYNTTNLHREIDKGTIVFVESVNHEEQIAFSFSIEKWKEGELTYKLLSDRAIFDTLSGMWNIHNYYERFFTDSTELVRSGLLKDTLLNLKMADFSGAASFTSEMDYFELSEYIRREKLKGSDKVAFYEIEMHQRTSLPLASYILTLLGASIASRKVRGGIGLHIALGFFLALMYIFTMKVTTVAATNAGMNPFLAVWTPNIIFGLISFWIYRKAPK